MKQAKRILKLANYLLFSKSEKIVAQILKYAEYTIEHTEPTVLFENGKIVPGVKFKKELS